MPDVAEPLLVMRKVGLAYGPSIALADASVTVAAGEVVALVGSSGSGKTSMLYCLAGLVVPDSGSVRFAGRPVHTLGTEARTRLRRQSYGFVFQFADLVPELTLRENISLPLELNGLRPAERRARVAELVRRLDIAHVADRRPAQVSGGQAQRAAVARAVAHRPQVVFADEPTGSLDAEAGRLVLETLLALSAEHGASVVLVTHDHDVAREAARTVVVRDGRTGSPC